MIQAVLLILLIALIVFVVLSRGNPGAYNLPIGILVVLVIVTMILRFTLFNTTETKMMMRYAQSVAYVLGQEVAKTSPSKILLIQFTDYDPVLKGLQKKQFAAFKQGLGSSNPEIDVFEPFPPSHLETEEQIAAWYSSHRWRKNLLNYLDGKSSSYDAMVSLIGLPRFKSTDAIEKLPPTYMENTDTEAGRDLPIATAGKLKGYVHLRGDFTSDHEVAATTSLEKVFASRYKYVDLQ